MHGPGPERLLGHGPGQHPARPGVGGQQNHFGLKMEYITPLNIVLVIFSGILLVLMYLIRNLLLKNEKYEDVVQDQVKYLQNISKIIAESQSYPNGNLVLEKLLM